MLISTWEQKSKDPGGLSPRSKKLAEQLPKPRTETLAAILKLESVRKQVKLTLEESRKVKELVSSSLQRYFALLPEDKVIFYFFSQSAKTLFHLWPYR